MRGQAQTSKECGQVYNVVITVLKKKIDKN
jgi:hypothetical protein